MQRWLGLIRSLLIYYGNPRKLRRMQQFYAQFIQPGDLCFDIGAHVGNRLWVWSKLGAQVVAVEPQPLCMALLGRWYGHRANVALVEAAVGATAGEATLQISERTPTVTTLSPSWIEQVQQADSFATVQWQSQVIVPVTTLDTLIAHYGVPAFCKIDVEGFEAEVLRGLSQPLAALSFEYVPATKEIALASISEIQRLANYHFNWSVGEQHRWQSAQWLTATEMSSYIARLAVDDMSGDIYARQV